MEKPGVKQISLSGDFEGVILRKSETGNLTVDLSALNGVDVTIITSGTVQLKVPAREQTPEQDNVPGVIHASVDKRAYNIGDVLPDGWVVGPVSPDTGIVMSIEPVAGALDGYKTWHQGENHAAELRGQGHENARQPTANELDDLYNGVVKAGHNQHAQFNTSGSDPFGKYWSSTTHPDYRYYVRLQYFDVGGRYWNFKVGANARVRCVRDEPGLTLA